MCFFYINEGPVDSRVHTKDVGFLAYPSGHYTTTQNAIIRFDKMDTNEGRGYNPSSGKFAAPVEGMYHFYWSLLTFQSAVAELHLMLNGSQRLRSLLRTKYWDTATASIYLKLKKGDEVYLKADRYIL